MWPRFPELSVICLFCFPRNTDEWPVQWVGCWLYSGQWDVVGIMLALLGGIYKAPYPPGVSLELHVEYGNATDRRSLDHWVTLRREPANSDWTVIWRRETFIVLSHLDLRIGTAIKLWGLILKKKKNGTLEDYNNKAVMSDIDLESGGKKDGDICGNI